VNDTKSWFIAGGAIVLLGMSGYVFWKGMFGQSDLQVVVSLLLWAALTSIQFAFTEIVDDFHHSDKMLYFGGLFSYAVGIGVGTMTWLDELALPSGSLVTDSFRLITAFGIAGASEILPEKLLRMWWDDYRSKSKLRQPNITSSTNKQSVSPQKVSVNNSVPKPGFPVTSHHRVDGTHPPVKFVPQHRSNFNSEDD